MPSAKVRGKMGPPVPGASGSVTAEEWAGRYMNQAARRAHLKGSVAKRRVWSGLHICTKGTGLNQVTNRVFLKCRFYC